MVGRIYALVWRSPSLTLILILIEKLLLIPYTRFFAGEKKQSRIQYTSCRLMCMVLRFYYIAICEFQSLHFRVWTVFFSSSTSCSACTIFLFCFVLFGPASVLSSSIYFLWVVGILFLYLLIWIFIYSALRESAPIQKDDIKSEFSEMNPSAKNIVSPGQMKWINVSKVDFLQWIHLCIHIHGGYTDFCLFQRRSFCLFGQKERRRFFFYCASRHNSFQSLKLNFKCLLDHSIKCLKIQKCLFDN